MAKKEGLRLVIELDPDEAQDFRKLAKTNKADHYQGIAKSLVLGATEVVSPKSVEEDIKLLDEMMDYGLNGDQRAKQEWADALSFTREQLESKKVKDAIASWAIYFGSNIEQLSEWREVPRTDQIKWLNLGLTASQLQTSLRSIIQKRL
jgi:hypothetical protein